jgi:flavin-dependent dehydrogenase
MAITPESGAVFDVAIVGGSVAGASLAIHLARRGRTALLLDRARFPRDKPCGEGIMPHGAAALRDLGILDALLSRGARRFAGIRYHAGVPGIAPATGLFPEVQGERLGVAVRRTLLDAVLLEKARRTPGVEVREGVEVKDLLLDASGAARGVRLASGEEVRARVTAGADGARSRVRRLLGLERESGERPRYGVVGHFAHAPLGDAERAWVDVTLAEACEAYLTPVSASETGIALLVEKPAMESFAGRRDARFLEVVRALPSTPAWLRDLPLAEATMACGPLAVRPARMVADGALLVGDAAGFLDAITGEGISIALTTAPAAAAAIDRAIERGDVSAHALAPYEARRKSLTRDPERLTRMVLLLAREKRIGRAAIRLLRARPALFRKLLGVNCGANGFLAVRPWELMFRGAGAGTAA